MESSEKKPSATPIPLPFPDITAMRADELERYFWSAGNTHEKAIELKTKELLRRVHERVQKNAEEIGMSKESYNTMFETYGYEETAKIIHLMKEGKAKTPEEAHNALSAATTPDLPKEEQRMDDVNKALQMKPLFRHSYKGGRLLEKMDRHEAYTVRKRIQKAIEKRAHEQQEKK